MILKSLSQDKLAVQTFLDFAEKYPVLFLSLWGLLRVVVFPNASCGRSEQFHQLKTYL